MSWYKTIVDSLAREINELDEIISQMQDDYDKAEALNSQDNDVQGYLIVISQQIHEKQAERSRVMEAYNGLVDSTFR